jgi:carboxypeptidase Q
MRRFVAWSVVACFFLPASANAQNFRSADTVIRRMWQVGIEQSQTERLAQVLMDSIGPRLSGTAGFFSAVEWLERTYGSWGIPARRERYGTWRSWREGAVHAEMIAPRHQNLEVELLAWSPGSGGRPVEGDVVVIPPLADTGAARAWLRTLRGKFVLVSAPEIMCRAPQELARNALPGTVTRINARRTEVRRVAGERFRSLAPAGLKPEEIFRAVYMRLDSAGVIGIGTSLWSGGWGVNKIFDAVAQRAPSIDLSCEDYGLLHRLASNNQGPRIRLFAESQSAPAEVPMFNVVAELRGTELPNEYIVLSAHLDSWHGATGATDNGTGTITMLEAMRILKETYPRPRRTIIAGHWGGEEQGTIGSLSFAEDHPDVIAGLQVAFNQDNGTWRVELLEAQGFLKAGGNLARWVAQLPSDMTDSVRIQVPGPQANAGSDHSSFTCRPAPAFRLQSSYAEYRQYTWHTNRDTYDKVVFDDLKNNATMAAMLAYAAAEDPERVPRDQAILYGQSGQPRPWPTCGKPARSWLEFSRPR